MRKTNKKNQCLWLSVLILFICVCTSIGVLASQMQSFLLDDTGAIHLIPEVSSLAPESANPDKPDKDTSNIRLPENSFALPDDEQREPFLTASPQETHSSSKPDLEVSDQNTVWSTYTNVEIFRVSYVNSEQVITVNSDNGDKIIAPGTENSYTFKLKNNGINSIDYTVSFEAYFTPGNIIIPVTARISRYDSKWIVGGNDEYADTKKLTQVQDSSTLGGGRYTYYTLDWLWPYESGNDELDTMLGNISVDSDLVFTVIIRTTATTNTNSNSNGGLLPPQTGDISNTGLWFVISTVSFTSMIVVIFMIKQKSRFCKQENEIGR